jgi:hypothetical protein
MIVSFPMWIDGRKRLLEDVVRLYPEVLEYHWTVHDFDGSGFIPGCLHYYEFEAIARRDGYPLEREELIRFIAGLTDVRDLLMTGLAADGRSANIETSDDGDWVLSFVAPLELPPAIADRTT